MYRVNTAQSKKILFLIPVLLLYFACGNESGGGWQDLDLLPHGVPLTIQAPDSVEVKARNLGSIMKDVTIKGALDPSYSLQIYASEATSSDVARLKAEQLSEVKSNPYFSSIIEEEEKGFIYLMKIDSATQNYGFRYVKIQGDQEYIFQTGLIGMFSEESVRKMYKAVQ